jgi:hypothetical protein
MSPGLPGIAHDPEKWRPAFRKDHAQTKRWQPTELTQNGGATAPPNAKNRFKDTPVSGTAHPGQLQGKWKGWLR